MSIAEKLKTVAANMTLLINKAKERGVYEWWHAYQTEKTGTDEECERTHWLNAFSGDAWDDLVYNPIRDITINNGSSNDMYAKSFVTNTKVTIDMSLAYTVTCLQTFRNSSIVTIPLLKVSEQTDMSNQFKGNDTLKHLTIEGTIASDANFQWCPLTYESAENVLRALKNFNTPNNYDLMFEYTIQFSDETWELLDNNTPDGFGSSTWRDYLTYHGWNF